MISMLTLGGDGSNAPSHPGDDPLNLDGSQVLFGSTAAHKPMGSIYYRIEKGLLFGLVASWVGIAISKRI
ncbi:MAG: hypothetical protein QXX84_02780 [Sulfolobales archaeon]|nr:hypothetical protein [Sulfolobales archaeon]